jgi:TPP-dependent pyruvate/acetoin dehydrogenase alpha subunit
MGGHTTSDDPRLYRTDEALAVWTARDPLRVYVARQPDADAVDIASRIDAEVRLELEEEIDAYLTTRGLS